MTQLISVNCQLHYQNFGDSQFGKVYRDSSIIEKKLETMLDINRALKQVYSTNVVTDKDGIAEGVIPLPAEYPILNTP